MSRNISIDQRYSEGELTDSPDFQGIKEMDEYESRCVTHWKMVIIQCYINLQFCSVIS
jgi:hypothetical protein